MNKMTDIYKRRAFKQLRFSLLIIAIYILGSKIILPGVSMEVIKQNIDISPFSFAISMTGMRLDNFSLFSLGLGPWMSTMILWRIISVSKFFKEQSLTSQQAYQLKILISFIIGGIQSLLIIMQLKDIGTTSPPWVSSVLLMTGGSILIWLGNMNNKYGIGGYSIIILIAVMHGFISRVRQSILLYAYSPQSLFIIVISFIFIIYASYKVFRFFQGERRIPLMYVMLDNRKLAQSYLPVLVNPSGGMPFMYSFSIVLFPQYLLKILLYFQPDNTILESIYHNIELDQISGVLLLMACVVILSYGFAYVNVDYKEITKNLKKSGNYFNNVYPGYNTEKYLFDILTRMATISALVNTMIIGLPMVGAILIPSLSTWAYVVPSWVILLIITDNIRTEFLTIYKRNNYESFL